MGEMRCSYRVLEGKSEGKRPLGDAGICRRIILICTFRKWDVRTWTG